VPFKKALYEELLVVFAAHFTAPHGDAAVSVDGVKG
jgi:putative (di)nucleoside polyphosphate hydrolase